MKPLKIQPVGDRILIRYQPEKEPLEGGILIPDSAAKKTQQAKVIAVGSGHRRRDGVITPFAVGVGDTVLIAPCGGAEVTLHSQRHTFVREDDILGILA